MFRLATTARLLPTMGSCVSMTSRPVLMTSRPALMTSLPGAQTSRVQQLATRARVGIKRKSEAPSLKERMMAPAGDGAFTVGRGVLAGASVIGLGALCYYGLGLSNEVGAVDKAAIWPQVVKDRIRDTYMYFGGGIMTTAAAAVAVSRNHRLMSMMMKNSWLAIGATFAVMIGSGMVTRSIPYSEGIGAKQLAWLVHSGIMGAVVAPITLLGGPLMVRAACYTAGVVGGLSTVAMCAPSEKFLYMGGPHGNNLWKFLGNGGRSLSGSGSSLPRPLAPCSCRRAQPWAPVSTRSLCTADSCCSAPSCSTTRRKSSTAPSTTPSTPLALSTPSTLPWGSTWTPSTSSSESPPSSAAAAAGESESEIETIT